MADKSEIEIINEKVESVKKKLEAEAANKERILGHLQTNQNYFYHWQNLEKQMDTVLHTQEESIFRYIEKNMGAGMLRAVLKKYIPDIKKELSETIESQLKSLQPPTNQ